jgi:hypothetical protein
LFLPQTSPRLFLLMRTADTIAFLNEQRYDLKRPALALCPLDLCLFALTPLANLHFLICAHFWLNALWLAAIYYANSLSVMGISFLIYVFFTYADVFRKATRT